MPTLEKTDGGLTRSALRYRPSAADTITVDEYTIGANTPVRRASRVRQPQADDAAQTGRGAPTATRVRRAPTMPTTLPHTPRPRSRLHPLFFLGIGMLATLALIEVLSTVTSWFTTTLDDLRYGRPRTFQIDAYVGHNESPGNPSHFLAVNLHGRIEIIELPGGDASHARIYIGPQLYGSDADLIPVPTDSFGILLNTGFLITLLGLGLSLTNWLSLLVIMGCALLGVSYRIHVEEHVLKAQLASGIRSICGARNGLSPLCCN